VPLLAACGKPPRAGSDWELVLVATGKSWIAT